MVEPLTLAALLVAVAVVAAVVFVHSRSKAPVVGSGGFTESELAALSSGKKDKRKTASKPKAAAPARSSISPQKPRAVSGKLKNVDGAADEDTDEQMLTFLEGKISLEQKRPALDDSPTEDKPKTKKSHEPAEKPAAGFTAVVDKKKAPKKEAEEQESEDKKEDDDKKKRSKPFYKDEHEAIKKEQELRKAEREKEAKEKAARPARPPRENGDLPPRKQPDSGDAAAGKERRPRPAGSGSGDGQPRPKREVPAVVPLHTEPFEEWSIDSMLDAITAHPVADKPRPKRSIVPAGGAAAAEVVDAATAQTD